MVGQPYKLSNTYLYREVRRSITKATSQRVSGIIYRITVLLVQSTCANKKENEGKQIDTCPERPEAEKRLCPIAIWARPWKPQPFIITRHC